MKKGERNQGVSAYPYQSSIEDILKAIKLNPRIIFNIINNNSTSIETYNKGNEYLEKCNYNRHYCFSCITEAIKYFYIATILDSTNEYAYYQLGYTLHEWSMDDDAITAFTKTIEINSKSDSAYNWRGFLFDRKGQHENALKDFQIASELCPNNKLYKENVEIMEVKLGLKKEIKEKTEDEHKLVGKYKSDNGSIWGFYSWGSYPGLVIYIDDKYYGGFQIDYDYNGNNRRYTSSLGYIYNEFGSKTMIFIDWDGLQHTLKKIK
jgi:tetratricopeptide (TPR) repeat protein